MPDMGLAGRLGGCINKPHIHTQDTTRRTRQAPQARHAARDKRERAELVPRKRTIYR